MSSTLNIHNSVDLSARDLALADVGFFETDNIIQDKNPASVISSLPLPEKISSESLSYTDSGQDSLSKITFPARSIMNQLLGVDKNASPLDGIAFLSCTLEAAPHEFHIHCSTNPLATKSKLGSKCLNNKSHGSQTANTILERWAKVGWEACGAILAGSLGVLAQAGVIIPEVGVPLAFGMAGLLTSHILLKMNRQG